jgi:hypothetical protein
MRGVQARWDGRARWLDGSIAAEGGTLQPTSLAACLGRACGLPGCHAGLAGWIPTFGVLVSPESKSAILVRLGGARMAISEWIPAIRTTP